ncbi:MAG: hypothetical protein WCL32_07805 [Planctomycetota bacterium]
MMQMKELASKCGISRYKLLYHLNAGSIPAPVRASDDFRAKVFNKEQVQQILTFFGKGKKQ